MVLTIFEQEFETAEISHGTIAPDTSWMNQLSSLSPEDRAAQLPIKEPDKGYVQPKTLAARLGLNQQIWISHWKYYLGLATSASGMAANLAIEVKEKIFSGVENFGNLLKKNLNVNFSGVFGDHVPNERNIPENSILFGEVDIDTFDMQLPTIEFKGWKWFGFESLSSDRVREYVYALKKSKLIANTDLKGVSGDLFEFTANQNALSFLAEYGSIITKNAFLGAAAVAMFSKLTKENRYLMSRREFLKLGGLTFATALASSIASHPILQPFIEKQEVFINYLSDKEKTLKRIANIVGTSDQYVNIRNISMLFGSICLSSLDLAQHVDNAHFFAGNGHSQIEGLAKTVAQNPNIINELEKEFKDHIKTKLKEFIVLGTDYKNGLNPIHVGENYDEAVAQERYIINGAIREWGKRFSPLQIGFNKAHFSQRPQINSLENVQVGAKTPYVLFAQAVSELITEYHQEYYIKQNEENGTPGLWNLDVENAFNLLATTFMHVTDQEIEKLRTRDTSTDNSIFLKSYPMEHLKYDPATEIIEVADWYKIYVRNGFCIWIEEGPYKQQQRAEREAQQNQEQ